MAGEGSPPNWSRLLTGLFGSFQSGAAQGVSTTDIWSAIRTQAGSAIFAAQGIAQPWDQAAVTQAGTAALSAQGVSGANVSTYRGIAGNWLAAKTRLQGLSSDQQILGNAIFTPPWSVTAGADVPGRYRLRSQWQLESASGVSFTRWKTDELATPLTTTADALDQASQSGQSVGGHGVTLSATPPVLLDYEIEQI